MLTNAPWDVSCSYFYMRKWSLRYIKYNPEFAQTNTLVDILARFKIKSVWPQNSSFFTTIILIISVPVRVGLPPMAQAVKNPPAMQERKKTQVWSPGWEDLLQEGMATHSSILAWKIPWTEEPDRLQSMGSQRVRHYWATSLSLFNEWLILLTNPLNLRRKWRLSGKHSLTTVFSPQILSFTGMIAGGLQDGHRVTIVGTVLPSGRSRHRTLSLSLTPEWTTMLSAQEGPPSILWAPTPGSGDGKGRPCQQDPCHPP